MPNVPVSASWTPSYTLSCNDCVDPLAFPALTTTYYVYATDQFGCEREDSVIVTVLDPFDIFIPTAFTPNFDGHNDAFYVLGGDYIEIIKTFRIYNRWGELIYEANEIPPGESQFGWNGMHNNVLAEMDVYVFYVEIELKNGRTFSEEGHVTLIH